MFTLMIGLSATGIAASYGVKLALSKQRRQDVKRALGVPALVPAGDRRGN